MAPAKQIQEVQDEEYMDDLITLVHDDEPNGGPTAGDTIIDVDLIETLGTNTKNQEASGTPNKPKLSQKNVFKPETTMYGRKHLERNSLSVKFFDSSRNVRLLSECRPLSVQVVDYAKHARVKSRVSASKTRKPPYRSYLALQKSSRNTDRASDKVFCCTLKQNNVLKIVNKNIISDLISADTLGPVDRQIKNGDNTKINVSEIKSEVNNKELKPETKKSAVASKTTIVNKMISNIDFKKNKGLVGLKITNRILKPESKDIPNSEKNNFIGYKISKTKCKEPKPPQIQHITDLMKTGNNISTISNSSEKYGKTKTDNCNKKIKSKDQIKSSTKLVRKTVVSSIKYNCKNLLPDMAHPSPALSGEENMQVSENKDNFGKSIAKSSDNKKLHEVSLKCKLKLDPQIASKFINKINDEAHTDQMYGNKHLSKEPKVEGNSNGKIMKDKIPWYLETQNNDNFHKINDEAHTDQIYSNNDRLSNEPKVESHSTGQSMKDNICYTKTQNNDNSCVEHTKDMNRKNDITKQGDLKVQTVSQINNSVGNVVSSDIITKNSNLNNKLIFSEQGQIPEVSEIKRENEIKKEFDDIPDSSEISQNIFDKIAVPHRSIFDEEIAKPDKTVETTARDSNQVVSTASDPMSASYNNTVDPHLLPHPMQNISVVRAIPPNMSSVRPVPPNVSFVRPIPPNVSSVRPIPLNISSVRPIPQNLNSVRSMPSNKLFSFIPPANNAYDLNNPNSSTHANPQFWPQPNANLRPPDRGLSKTIDQQFLDPAMLHHWQNKNISANTNLPLGQRLAPPNEMHNHLIPPWQHRNDPVNINLPSPNIGAYNPQNPIAEIPMQWQQSVQSQNQMPFDMLQRNFSQMGDTQTCSYSNSYLNNTNENSFNLLSHEGSLRVPLPPPPPSSQRRGDAIYNVDTHTNHNQDKSTNDTLNQFKKASLITAAGQRMELEEGHKILSTSKTKVSARMVAKPRNENNLVYVSSLESDGNTVAPKVNLNQAAKTYSRGETPNKIRLIPPQTSAKQFSRLTPETCSSYNSNLLSVPKGYSPPILPIPTPIEFMRIVNAMKNQSKNDDKMTKSLNNPDKTHIVVRRKNIAPISILRKTTPEKKPPNKRTIATHGVKKISLEEYKKRTSQDNVKCIDLTLDENKQSKEGEVKKLKHDRVGNVERQSVDSQDLGYDSDITVKL